MQRSKRLIAELPESRSPTVISATSPAENTETITFERADVARQVFGFQNEHLRVLEKAFHVDIGSRGTEVTLKGGRIACDQAQSTLNALYRLCEEGYRLTQKDVGRSIDILQKHPDADLADIFLDTVFTANSGRLITPNGLNQKNFVTAMRQNDVVFGVGPAGTGKTYLAVAMALAHYFDGRVKRIVLTRPAVEAGENLGFLPGDLLEKVDPYLRPLHDVIRDLLDTHRQRQLAEAEVFEIAPLAYMRGRTLDDAFIILDEAQNTTAEQMKMFLTRLGNGSRAVVTGDPTQIDLRGRSTSGLIDAERRLADVAGLEFCYFGAEDVVRHELVQAIIQAYERQ
jgi:phosphate starvation-inducible protein PhoH and related proteins